MRKALKTKTLLLLISWLVIFMHGVIPHLHANHDILDLHSAESSGSFECIYSHDIDSHQYGQSPYFLNKHNHNSNVCHFNPNLFSQLDLDYSYILTPECDFRFSDIIVDIQRPETQTRYKKPPLLTYNSLRAPPLV